MPVITRAVPADRTGATRHLTAVFEVESAEAASLQMTLGSLGSPGPFAAMPMVRHARLVVLDGLPGDARRNWRIRPRPPVAYLLFSAAYEGELEPFVAALVTSFGDRMAAVFGRCVGFPAEPSASASAAEITAFLRRHLHKGLITFSTYRGSLADIRRALALRDALVALVADAPGFDVAGLRARLALVPGDRLPEDVLPGDVSPGDGASGHVASGDGASG